MKTKGLDFRGMLIKYGIYFVLVALFILFAALKPRAFLSSENIFNILRQVSVVGIASAGMTCVMLTAGIDLSVGAVIGIVGVITALFISPEKGWGLGLPLGLTAGMVCGLILGFVNGFIVTKLKMFPMIATLGTMTSIRGAAYLITGGKPIFGFPKGFSVIGQGYIWVIPIPVIIMIIMFFITYILLNKLRIGRYIYGVGGNEEASRLSGVDVQKIKYFVYAFSGLCCAIAGIVLLSRTNSGTPKAGTSYEMSIITAVVLGGVSINGGEGKITGVIAGVLIMGVLANGMIIVGLSDYVQQVIQGLVLIAAVAFDVYAKQIKQLVSQADTAAAV
ncbi:ABC transporter permease [Leadbettera azotonutricia]|uniref:Ribose transport system permease protein RbsC n=1 Tax=Leadbettera azotonutricia (strain ATCC BAA-888 / DSM 13862 / ZAS-9) TaxID=545695 RepID=F5Y9K3_LEAAZ|nr:ABC transporter permease [Leadbettera azotonutricia]AEF82187.1 ribose transport system permease protein RbsC [Leadbettera azotonutricia ZAS-9]